jgi:hypothetical protein
MTEERKDFDSLENYLQNSIAQAASMGVFSLAASPLNLLTQFNNKGTEINDNINEAKEKVADINKLEDESN